jgi:hypothetical protein
MPDKFKAVKISESSTSTMRIEVKQIPREVQQSIETNLRVARSVEPAKPPRK